MDADDYFERFLAARMNQPLLAGYEGFSAQFSIELGDLARRWRLEVAAGRLVEIAEFAPAAADECAVRYRLDSPVFAELAACRLSPQVAFFARRTEIHGDLFLGLKIARVLGLFFERHPYSP